MQVAEAQTSTSKSDELVPINSSLHNATSICKSSEPDIDVEEMGVYVGSKDGLSVGLPDGNCVAQRKVLPEKYYSIQEMKMVIPSTRCRRKKMFFSTPHDEFCSSGHDIWGEGT